MSSTPPAGDLYPPTYRAAGWDTSVQGRKTSLTGLWIGLGVLGLVLLSGIVATGLLVGRDIGTDPVASVPEGPDTINAIQAEVGLCLEDVGDAGHVGRVTAVPCSDLHRAEVVADYRFDEGPFPGAAAVRAEMLDYCGRVIQPGYSSASMFQPTDWEDGLRWVAWAPTADSWEVDDRTGVCVVYRNSAMRGSFVAGTVVFSGTSTVQG